MRDAQTFILPINIFKSSYIAKKVVQRLFVERRVLSERDMTGVDDTLSLSLPG